MNKIVVLALCVLLPNVSFAAWKEAKELISGSIGGMDGQFGVNEKYLGVDLPFFTVGADSLLFVGDRLNMRTYVYDAEGDRIGLIAPEIAYSVSIWPTSRLSTHNGVFFCEWGRNYQFYSINGELLSSFELNASIYKMLSEDGEIIVFDKISKKYKKYSPSGELIATYDEKPLALGVKTASRRADTDNRYDTEIKFEDRTYRMILDGLWDDFVRDQEGNIYFYNSYTATDPVSGEDSEASLVVKYDPCGKFIGRFDLPITEYEPLTELELSMPTSPLTVRNEYGPPVIGPDGSIYAHKRTPDTYSILKWEWVDDPNDPLPGPDAPSELGVTPSTTGLYLTWQPSPQDPGCVSHYEIERAGSADGSYSSIATIEAGTLNYSDADASVGSIYFYKVRASAGGSYSDYTETVSGTRPQ